MELIQVGNSTYYIKNPTNIGIYKIDEKNVYLIDSGNDKEAGKKILKIIEEQGWTIKGIINTHSNADHIGGNKVIQSRTNCEIISSQIESSFIENPIIEPSFLYGGKPFKELCNKFLLAEPSLPTSSLDCLPKGLKSVSLKGHFFNMIGIKTSDDVYFIGDSIFSEETINKYHLFYIYDLKEYLNTLDYLNTLNNCLLIPSHGEIANDLTNLISTNKAKINEIITKILTICKDTKTFEEILKEIFDSYNLTMNANQYFLVGSTVKSYLSYLKDENRLTFIFENNQMLWQSI